MIYESIFDIDFELLIQDGVRHLFFDVDNTLIGYNDTQVSLQCMNIFNALPNMGFEHIILVSNNSNVDRIDMVAKQLKLPAVTFACKPFDFTMRRLFYEYGIQPQHSAMIGDQLLTDVLLANRLDMVSIFTDPIDVESVSMSKKLQYRFQSYLFRLFS